MTDQGRYRIAKDKVDELASEYQRRGYQVYKDPASLPGFLAGLAPDLVAISDDDKVVVEVKVRHDQERMQLHPLAEAISKEQGWRLELVVLDTSPPPPRVIAAPEVRRRIDDASRLVETSPVAAILLGWTAIEALLRMLLAKDGVSVESMSPVKMIKTARSQGLLSQGTADLLLNAARLRNSVIHGLTADESLLQPKMVGAFLREIESLFEQVENVHQETTDATAEQIVEWFFDNYEDPANGVPYETAEGGYIYYLGGPYDASEVISEQFPDTAEEVLQVALRKVGAKGHQWVKKGQYP